jgi:hypothetical protein
LVWLTPNRSALRDDGAVHRLLRSWGGEALYNGFEDDPVLAPVLRKLRQPMLIKCAIDLPTESGDGWHAAQLLSQAVANEVHHPEPTPYFDLGLPRGVRPDEIVDVIAFGSEEFERLTGASEWPADRKPT